MLVCNVLIFALTALSAGALPAPVKNDALLESAADAELAGRSPSRGIGARQQNQIPQYSCDSSVNGSPSPCTATVVNSGATASSVFTTSESVVTVVPRFSVPAVVTSLFPSGFFASGVPLTNLIPSGLLTSGDIPTNLIPSGLVPTEAGITPGSTDTAPAPTSTAGKGNGAARLNLSATWVGSFAGIIAFALM